MLRACRRRHPAAAAAAPRPPLVMLGESPAAARPLLRAGPPMALCYTSALLVLALSALPAGRASHPLPGSECQGGGKGKGINCSGSKWVVKQWRQLTTSTTHLGQELLMNVQCSGGSRSFANETIALKMGSVVAGHRKLTMTNGEQSLQLILLQLHEKLLETSRLTILWLFRI